MCLGIALPAESGVCTKVLPGCDGASPGGVPVDSGDHGSMTRTVWTVVDRRVTEETVISDMVAGETGSTYATPEAAYKAVYPTEKVLEITITVVPDTK